MAVLVALSYSTLPIDPNRTARSFGYHQPMSQHVDLSSTTISPGSMASSFFTPPSSISTSTLNRSNFAPYPLTLRPDRSPFPLNNQTSTPPNNITYNTPGTSVFPAQHQLIEKGKAVDKRHEHGLTLEKAAQFSKSRLRAFPCPCNLNGSGYACDAVLASWSLLRRHVQRHSQYAIKVAYDDQLDDLEAAALSINCSWRGCAVTTNSKVKSEQHIDENHLATLLMSNGTGDLLHHVQDLKLYPQLARPRLRDVLAPRVPRPLPEFDYQTAYQTDTTPVISAYNTKPVDPIYQPITRYPSRYPKLETPRLHELEHSITRQLDTAPFLPAGDAPIWYALSVSSSSIFPQTVEHRLPASEAQLRKKLAVAWGTIAEPESMALETTPPISTSPLPTSSQPLTVIPKPSKSRVPACTPSARVYFSWRKGERRKRKRDEVRSSETSCDQRRVAGEGEDVDMDGCTRDGRLKGKAKSNSKDPSPTIPATLPKFSKERIHLVATRRASRITGHSIGYPFWKQKRDFESAGKEFGEL